MIKVSEEVLQGLDNIYPGIRETIIPVYEVSFTEGRYEVTSQPIPIQDPEAASLIRVIAVVIPKSDADTTLLEAVKTDDVIRVRGMDRM